MAVLQTGFLKMCFCVLGIPKLALHFGRAPGMSRDRARHEGWMTERGMWAACVKLRCPGRWGIPIA